MPTTRMQSTALAALLGLFGSTLLFHSLHVHPQDKEQPPSATQSQEGGAGQSGGASTGQAGASSADKLSDRDQKMMKQLAEAHLGEIQLGKMAQDKAQSDEVKSFAKKMVDDHTKALDDLKQIAQSKGATLPEEPGKQQMAMQKKLEGQSGAKFDRQYMQQAGKQAHQSTHKLLQRTASRAEDSDLKNYATKAIGTVESHMQMARETTENMKATSQGKSGTGEESSGASSGDKSSGQSGGGSTSSPAESPESSKKPD